MPKTNTESDFIGGTPYILANYMKWNNNQAITFYYYPIVKNN